MALIPNDEKNEVLVTLNGNEYIARPTFTFLKAVETVSGTGYRDYAINQVVPGKATLDQIVTLLMCAIKESGQAVSQEQLEEDIVSAGHDVTYGYFTLLVATGYKGHDSESKKK